MKKIALITLLMFFANAFLFSQIDTCICERVSIDGCKDNFETVTETVMIRPECNGQPPIYQTIKKRVTKMPCCGRIIKYPCDCKEKNRAWNFKEEEIPAEYITITVYDCYGRTKKQSVMVKSERKVIKASYPPELKKRK